MSSALRRATLFVADIAKAKAFYQEVFGFALYRENAFPLSLVPHVPIGPEPRAGTVKLVVLKGPDPEFGMIGLLEVADPPLPAPAADHRRLGRGNVGIVLSVADVDAVDAAIPRHGGTVLMPVTASRNLGDATGEFVQTRMIMAYDPDGYFLEIFQVV